MNLGSRLDGKIKIIYIGRMRIHIISIGGSIMHQLAICLKEEGHIITGSDDEIYDPSRSNLEREGLLPATFGWSICNINNERL